MQKLLAAAEQQRYAAQSLMRVQPKAKSIGNQDRDDHLKIFLGIY
jgi:hypothetical protein